MILPYYKIEKTEEGRQFFYSNIGYFNFWGEYLVMNIEEGYNKKFLVLVNRPKTKFTVTTITNKHREDAISYIKESVYEKRPEEMFIDFLELEKFDFLKNEV